VRALAIEGLDWRICYQSRVGPQKWIEPYTEVEVARAAAERRPVVLSPIAFVSEHIETLVEMDHDYAEVARQAGGSVYLRVPALSAHPEFIGGLAAIVRRELRAAPGRPGPVSNEGARLCPSGYGRCPCLAAVAREDPATAAAE
jgi:protoporphyrin/coproporphyrin ferrochelatase